MTRRQKNLVIGALSVMLGLLLFIVFGENGAVDLYRLHRQHLRLVQSNASLMHENQQMYQAIDRLQNDPTYVENVARQELGMIRADEVIFKFKAPLPSSDKP